MGDGVACLRSERAICWCVVCVTLWSLASHAWPSIVRWPIVGRRLPALPRLSRLQKDDGYADAVAAIALPTCFAGYAEGEEGLDEEVDGDAWVAGFHFGDYSMPSRSGSEPFIKPRKASLGTLRSALG